MVEFDWNSDEMGYMRDLLDHLYPLRDLLDHYPLYANWIFVLQKFKEENNINFEIILDEERGLKSILWESEEEYLAFRLRFHNICT